MNKTTALQQLNQDWQEKCTCELKNTATQPVFGAGNTEAEIVFIGEAPGKTEDTTGIPFMGRAGKFLDEMLTGIKMDRNQVYITNTVKYRPPDNRDPKPSEIDACRQWLLEELTLIEPAVIVTLGRYALNYFIPTAKISEVHGTILHQTITPLKTDTFFSLYHPAAALYNGSLREVLQIDFKKLPQVLDYLSKRKK